MNNEKENSNKCPICGKPTHKESKYCIFHASAEEKTEEDFKRKLKKYTNKIKEEDKDYNFEGFIFIGDIIFEKDLNVDIFKNADFNGAFFKGNARFMGATFEGEASFCGTTFKRGADFKGATFKEDSIFNRATFKGDNRFEGTSFKGNAFFQEAIFEVGADFEETNFKGDADFKGTKFNGGADFKEINFKGHAGFDSAFFKGDAHFRGATFEGSAEFEGSTFKGSADFKGSTFKRSAVFVKVIFSGKVDFVEVDFWRDAYFKEATFETYAYFGGATFGGYAYFQQATFVEDTYFQQATFGGDTYFILKKLMNIIDFSEIRISSGKKLSIKIINEGGKINFHRAYLENADLDMDLVKGILVDFTGALLRNTKLRKSQIKNYILQENKKNYNEAKEIYLLIKNNFHSIGQYEDESWAFKKEKDMERKSNCHFKSTHKWFWSSFLNIIYGYGEKPWNVIFSAGILIFIFALSFNLIGIGNPEIIELRGTTIQQNSGDIVDLVSKGFLKNTVTRNFPDSLYFSLITFTTLGYGDFRPLEGLGRILAGSEAFIGAFMMALFVFTFARRTGGR